MGEGAGGVHECLELYKIYPPPRKKFNRFLPMSQRATQPDKGDEPLHGRFAGCVALDATHTVTHSLPRGQPAKRGAGRATKGRTGDASPTGRNPRALSPGPCLQLGSRQVDIRDHLCAGVLHLQAGIQLQEVETAILAVEIFYRPRAHVAHSLGQADGTLQRRHRA